MFKSYLVSWKKSFDFKSRSKRKEYWIFFLITNIFLPIIFVLFNIIQNILDSLIYYFLDNVWSTFFSIASNTIKIFSFLLVLIALGHRWTLLPLTVRRIRDVGMKWQWIFFASIPFIGDIFVLIFLTRNSVEEINGKKYFPKY